MSTENNRTNDEAPIRTLRDALTKAIRAKDADGVVSHFAAETVMFVLAPPLQFKGGASPGRNGVEEWFSTFQGSIDYEIRDLHITAGETVAFCHSLNRISGARSDGGVATDSDGGAATDIWVRETLDFRKISGEWKITHQHQSVPFYMDGSNRAAVDLKP